MKLIGVEKLIGYENFLSDGALGFGFFPLDQDS